MFEQLRNEVLLRLVDIDRFCKKTCSPDGDRLAAVGRGMAFVNMYATYEYCVRTSVQSAILAINAHSVSHCDVRWELLGITLDGEIKAVAESKNIKKWNARLSLFERLFSADCVKADETVLPGISEHFNIGHLGIIWRYFGMSCPTVPDSRLIGFVGELVEHRNAVSHGRKTAYDVGKGYTTLEIDQRVKFTQELCLHVILSMEQHCTDIANVRRT